MLQQSIRIVGALLTVVTVLCTMSRTATDAIAHPNPLLPSDSLARAFVSELNAMRANPKAFIPKIDAYQRQLRSFTPSTSELDKAVKEIKKELAKLKPLNQLSVDTALALAATDHMLDGQRSGLVGHMGSDGSDPGQRVARYGQFRTLSESITYGHMSSSLMLAAFLVDEGTPSRGHRKSMLSQDYTLIGVAVGGHPQYDSQVVVLLASR
jgi:uncharacterized protein YkwD